MATNWKKASTTFDYRNSFTTIYGDVETGTSTLALTAPGKIYLLTTGDKIEGIMEYAALRKDIEYELFCGSFQSSLKGPDKAKDIMAQADIELDLFEEHWHDALGSEGGSLVVDIHNDMYALVKYSMFGDYKPSSGRVDANFGPVTEKFRALLGAYRAQDFSKGRGTNLILVGETTPVYVNNKATDKTVPKWQGSIEKKSQVVLRTRLETKKDKSAVFTATVEKGWTNIAAKGKVYTSNVHEVMAKAQEVEMLPYIWGDITGTDPKEWT